MSYKVIRVIERNSGSWEKNFLGVQHFLKKLPFSAETKINDYYPLPPLNTFVSDYASTKELMINSYILGFLLILLTCKIIE